ncbi:MAG: ATP-grasp domain-containing protein [Chloroflexi bacterium]|nr:ATP-grasp domain-containing protein [Chloroflexota bacterium]
MGAMDIVRPLGIAGIRSQVVAQPHRPTRYSRFTVGVIEHVDPYRRAEDLVHRLVSFARTQERRPVLFYDNDGYLALISRFRAGLADHFAFIVPDATLVEDLLDKQRFLSLATRLALPIPATRHLTHGFVVSDVDLTFPLILKPLTRDDRDRAWVHVGGFAKAIRFQTRDALRADLPRLQRSGMAFIAQTLIPGPETAVESYHVYADVEGSVVADFAGRKIRTLPPEFGHSTALVTTVAADVISTGRQIVRALGFTGVAKMDFKRDRAGQLHLLEINPRFTLWNHLGARAGINVPAIVFGDLAGWARPTIRPARAGVTWCDLWKDARAARLARVPFVSWLRWVASCDVKSELAWDDPLPFLLGKVAARPLRAIARRGGTAH